MEREELVRYLQFAEGLRQDLSHVCADVHARMNGTALIAAVDFSELYSYAAASHPDPTHFLWRGVDANVALIVERVILYRLFENESANVVLLAPHVVELESFLDRHLHQYVGEEFGSLAQAYLLAYQLRNDPTATDIVRSLEEAGLNNHDLADKDVARLLSWLEQGTRRDLLPKGRRQIDRMERVRRLLESPRLNSIDAYIANVPQIDPTLGRVRRRADELSCIMPGRNHAANVIDAQAIETVFVANEIAQASRSRVLLFTRSKALLNLGLAEEARGEWNENGGMAIRHSRCLSNLVCLDTPAVTSLYLSGKSNGTDVAGNLRQKGEIIAQRLRSIELFIQQTRAIVDGVAPAIPPKDFLNLHDELRALQNEITRTTALAPHQDGEPGESRTQSSVPSDQLVVDLRVLLRKDYFQTALNDHVDRLSRLVDLSHEVLGVLVPTTASKFGSRFGDEEFTFQQIEQQVVMRTGLDVMPYRLQFDEFAEPTDLVIDARKWVRWVDLRQWLSKTELLEQPAKRLIVLAYVLAASRQWTTARMYCEAALESCGNESRIEGAESLLLAALCIRKNEPDERAAHRAQGLVEKAIAMKRRLLHEPSYIDPRYETELATINLNLAGHMRHSRTGNHRVLFEKALDGLNTAFDRTTSDQELRIVILNNLCYAYIDAGEGGYYGKLAARCELLRQALERRYSHPRVWPTAILDTVFWSAFQLATTAGHGSHIDYKALAGRLHPILRRSLEVSRAIARGSNLYYQINGHLLQYESVARSQSWSNG